MLATYDNTTQKLHYAFNDWLSDKRVQYATTGPGAQTLEESCWNLPFNDDSGCSAGSDISNFHYTGKPHDNNTQLYLFGAHNCTCFSGRFMSPMRSRSQTSVQPTTVTTSQ